MLEVTRPCKDAMLPIGTTSVWPNRMWTVVYDHFEDEEKEEYVEIHLPRTLISNPIPKFNLIRRKDG